METLIAEDLLLLLLDDEKGTMAAASYERPLLGGALLVELALLDLVRVEEKRSMWHSAKVHVLDPTGPGVASPDPALDPALGEALGTIAERPRSAGDLVQRLGKGVRDQLLARLESRGMLERHEGRVLGIFPRTTWPAADLEHERQVRERLHGVLVHGLTPDPRTGALVALLHAVDQAHRLVREEGLPAREVKRRAKEISEGDWAARAVKDAVAATQAAMIAVIAAGGAAAGS